MRLRIFAKDQQREPSKSLHCHRGGVPTGDQKSSESGRLARFLLPLMGLACLIWMLVRVIPKPSRAEYPCMKVAAPIAGGFIYLCAVIDWYSRAVLAWELSNTLDAGFCVRAVQRALAQYGPPEIFNTDQG